MAEIPILFEILLNFQSLQTVKGIKTGQIDEVLAFYLLKRLLFGNFNIYKRDIKVKIIYDIITLIRYFCN